MKKILNYFFVSVLIFFNINLFGGYNINADYIQTSDPQHSESLAADDILTSDHQNTVIVDIANVIVDIGNLKNYIDSNLGTIWTETSTQISYDDKDVYFGQNLRVVDTIHVGGNVDISEGGLKDNTITTSEIINGEIKKEDLNPEIFASLDTLWKLNGNNGYYNSGNVGIGDNNPSEKLVVDGNIKFDTVGKGIIFPDGTIQTTGNIDESNNMKLTGDQIVRGIKTFKKPIQLKNGVSTETLTGDYYLGDNGEYCAMEGETCNVSGTKRIIYGAKGQYVEKIVNGNITCNNTTFGTDPAPGLRKTCFISEVGNDIIANKLAIKKYIDNNLREGNSVSCNKDNNGKKIKIPVNIEEKVENILDNKQYIKTNFSLNTDDTASTYRCPQVSSNTITVDGNCGNDERLLKREKNAINKNTVNGYITKIVTDYQGTIDTADCRGASVYTNFYKDNDNFIQINTRSSRQSSRSYNCSGSSCNTRNFGANWSCVSGNNCGRGSWLHLTIEQNNKRWNYIYMLNNLSTGNYKYYNEVDLKNKKWKIKVTDLSGNIKYNETVTLPTPTNGLDLTKIKGIYKTGVGAGRSCGKRSIYTKILKFELEEENFLTKKTYTLRYPIDLSSVSNNLCINGNATNTYTCIDKDGNEFNCNSGDIKDNKVLSSKWNCSDGNIEVNCGANFDYYCKPDIKTKTENGKTVYYDANYCEAYKE